MTIVSGMISKLRRAGIFKRWSRKIADKFASSNELQGMDREEFKQIALDLNLSVADLDALSRRSDSSGDLLRKRLAEFGLSQEGLTDRQPEVLRDLLRVCGNCASTRRCASEFEQENSNANHSDYCPNTQTLQALESEDLQAGARASLPVGPCCC
jgi:hypothetical protein